MDSRSIYQNISPLDHRYSLSDPALFARLSAILGEEASIKYCARVEVALLKTLLRHLPAQVAPAGLEERLDAAAEEISPGEVYAEEATTHHNVRALVNVLKRHLPETVRPYAHLGATSVDILDTAASLRYKEAIRSVILPLLVDLELELVRRAREEAETPQIGRTHGQHAVPITFGFALAEYVARLGKSILRIHEKSEGLRGKLAGAVGAYNATSLLVKDPQKLELEFLAILGLTPSEHSTQLVEPEHLLALLLELNTAFGIIANLADDLRNLQRSEIGEVHEEFAATQVGSSTMPQKRNPWNSEHVKSLWKEFCPRVITFFMDQISEHQRDLTNSATARFVPEFIAGFASAAERMRTIIHSLGVDRRRMAENLAMGGDLIFSEPVYVLIALGGDAEAHERVRAATLRAEKTGAKLADILRQDAALWEILTRQLAVSRGLEAGVFFSDPANYRGLSSERARRIADTHAQAMQRLSAELKS
ncbi:MAG: lyase family protein [Spirochaetia bacterium]